MHVVQARYAAYVFQSLANAGIIEKDGDPAEVGRHALKRAGLHVKFDAGGLRKFGQNLSHINAVEMPADGSIELAGDLILL